MKYVKKIINIVIFLFLVINIFGLFFINIHFNGLGLLKAVSDTLSPTINKNDLIIYKKARSYNQDQLIVYNIDNKYSIAKIERREEYLTYIKDNTSNVYDPVSNADVRGTVKAIIKPIYILIYFLFVVIILIYLIITIVLSLSKLKLEEQAK